MNAPLEKAVKALKDNFFFWKTLGVMHYKLASAEEIITVLKPFFEEAGLCLAEKCFSLTRAEDDLFDEINRILGCNTEDCLKDGFKWGAVSTWWDEYDTSVEVVRPKDSEWMTPEQVKAILDLGFGCVYESIGENGRLWNQTGFENCSPREQKEVQRLKAEIEILRKSK